MKNVKRSVIIMVALMSALTLFSISCVAETIYEQDGFYYGRSSNKTADLYGRSSTDADMVIPKDFSEYYVTNIVDNAFENDQNLEAVTFGDATLLERIGFYAFKNCINLTGQVNLVGRINTIGVSAFEDCHSLETVIFNAYIKDIPDQCFYNCNSLNTVIMNNKIESIGKYAFGNCTSLESITIPDSVTSINSNAFDGCENLVINCNTDSYAHQFAQENGIEFLLLDAPIEVTFIMGDSDGDGFITVMDATTVQRVLADLDDDPDGMIALRAADGKVLNIMHATAIQRYLADFEVSEPIGQEVTRTVTI